MEIYKSQPQLYANRLLHPEIQYLQKRDVVFGATGALKIIIFMEENNEKIRGKDA